MPTPRPRPRSDGTVAWQVPFSIYEHGRSSWPPTVTDHRIVTTKHRVHQVLSATSIVHG